MVMKPLKKSTLRAIRKNTGRYLAILAIIALGVGIFCGLRICRTAMVRSGDQYVQKYNLFDYRLISTLGFTAEDESYFSGLDGVNCAEGAIWLDFLYEDAGGNSHALRAHSMTEQINGLSLVAGRMPEAPNEMLVDARCFSEADLGIQIRLSGDNDADTLEAFRYDSYTVVGLVNSVYYMNYERGSTSIGSGSLEGFVYLPYEGFDVDYFSEIFVDIDAPGEIYSDEYNASLAAFEDYLESQTQSRTDLRYQSLVDDALQEVSDAQAELDEKYADYQAEKQDAQEELLDAHTQLEDARQQIADGEAELSKNEDKLDSALSEYHSGKKKYNQSKKTFEEERDSALSQLKDAQTEIDQNRAQVQEGIRQIEESGVLENHQGLLDGIAQLDAGIEEIEAQREALLGGAREQLAGMQGQMAELDAGIAALESARGEALAQYQQQIDALNTQIAAWEAELSALEESISESAGRLHGQIAQAQEQISGFQADIAQIQSEYESRIASLNEQKDALNGQISAIEAERDAAVADLQSQVDSLRNQISAWEEELAALEGGNAAQIQALQDQISGAQGQIAGLEDEIDAAMSACEGTVSTLNGQIAELDGQISAAQSALGQTVSGNQSQIDALKGQISAWESQLSGLDEGNPEQAGQIQSLKDQISAAKGQISGLESAIAAEKSACEEKVSALNGQRSALEEQISAAQASRDQTVQAKQGQIDALKNQISSWKQEIAALEESGAGDSAQAQKLREQIAAAQGQISNLEGEISRTKADYEEKLSPIYAQMSELDGQIASAGTQRDEAVAQPQAQIQTLEGQISAWQAELAALEESIAAPAQALRDQISGAQAQMNALKDQMSAAEGEWDGQISALSAQKRELQAGIDAAEAQIAAGDAEFDAQKAALEEQRGQLQAALTQIEQSGVLEQYDQAQAALAQLESAQQELDARSAQAKAEFESYQAQLDDAKSQLNQAWRQIESGESQLADGYDELEDARRELKEGLADYETALVDAEMQFMDAEAEFSDAQAEIDEAQEEIAEIEPATFYALNRKTNVGYACFGNDSQIVQGISAVFPLFFLLVAALVCTTTMTRMVDEQRTEIGTLKALGYSKAAVMSKYLFYSGSAAAIGALIGYFGGCYLFPKVIWMAYDVMYGFASIPYVLNPLMGAVSFAAALACSMGATFFSCNLELARVPAELIRPKAPKAGKRVLMERVGFIWRRLSFLHKVMVRNVFRYKKRLLMMVTGIGGCAALLVTGFGINDSIANLANDQFGRIMQYDLSVSFSEDLDSKDQAAFVEELGADAEKISFLYQGSVDVAYADQTRAATLMLTDSDLEGLMDLHAGETGVSFPEAGQCIISRGLEERCGFAAGDTITIYDSDMQRMTLQVSGVFDNYIDDYVIARTDAPVGQWNDIPGVNSALLNSREGMDPHALGARISEDENVSNVTISADTRSRFDNMMASLNYVVILVVICAAALAFIVLYNLTNINITERIREIATVKVLGFTLKETASYALSENVVLSAVGALVGLPLGKALHSFVMAQIRVDMVIFDVRVTPLSYAISFGLTLGFALLVNLVMLRKIDHINMAESLKTIE